MSRRTRWTPEEDAQIIARYPDTPTRELARALGRGVAAVYNRARKLGVEKSDAYLASPLAGRTLRGDTRGLRTRYPKGHVPANKGLRLPGWAPGRMRETQFVKGAKPHTWVPVGTESVRDGYVWIKVRDDLTPSRLNWMSKHQHLWEQAHGPVPDGHIVRFKDANRAHLVLENLECVSREEHARTKGLHSLPPEIVHVHQLRAAIARQINKRQPPAPARRGRPPKLRTA